MARGINFNPRTPCGVRPGGFTDGVSIAGISIHAPHAGCDTSKHFVGIHAKQFQSTHPMRGATRKSGLRRCDHLHFNPRTPCGVRRKAIRIMQGSSQFQSTHPMRGATDAASSLSSMQRISIHAPHAGCDLIKSTLPVGSQPISIHAPHAGCDLLAS